MAIRTFRLRLYHDHVTEGACATLAAERRVIFCVCGDAALSAPGRSRTLTADQAWFSEEEVTLRGQAEGARLWRFELVPPDAAAGEIGAAAVKSVAAGDYEIAFDTSVGRLMRLDRVGFPPGGEALTHIHAAPGIRCLERGSLLLDSAGKRYRVWPGDSWVEHGPDPVYAKASEREPSSFVRCMIVPAEYRGRSTIAYVRPEDADRPKSQQYTRYLEEPIGL